MTDIIEQIAQRWFEANPATQAPRWADQPADIQNLYRALARQFWADPGKLTRELQSVAISTRSMTNSIDRATKAWT